ncbi:MAG TPA: PPOX class F420-dependent oxidoreductase [Amycolatopsis sp.]|nr:PPOX class F420-dependent oxidoreductase [Amycolatopsis sp.]
MAGETQLWELIATGRQAVLATSKRNGLPQLSNVLYLPEPDGRTVRISTTAERRKTRNLARDPRAVLHVSGKDFWAYAVAEGRATLSPVATEPGDEACQALLAVHTAFYGELDTGSFYSEMITNRRLVVRLDLDHVYGIIAPEGRRPVAAASDPGPRSASG